MAKEKGRGKPTAITLNEEERALLDKLTELLKYDSRSATIRALAREKMEELERGGVAA